MTTLVRTAHHGRGGCGLIHLVLGGLDLGLQMGRRVEVLALFPGAAALDVVHAHGDGVVVGVDHGAVCGVGEAAVVFAPGAVSPLIFPTHLETNSNNNNSTRSRKSTQTYAHSTTETPHTAVCCFV